MIIDFSIVTVNYFFISSNNSMNCDTGYGGGILLCIGEVIGEKDSPILYWSNLDNKL